MRNKTTKITSSKDLIVLLLAGRGHTGQPYEAIYGRTRLMKMVFLFEKELRPQFNKGEEISDNALPEFEADNYGPFSPKVFSDLEFLINNGFVKVGQEGNKSLLQEEIEEYSYWQATSLIDENDVPVFEEKFELTQLGQDFVKSGKIGVLNENQQNALDEFKQRCTAVKLRDLLRYVYTQYPETTIKSQIRDQILSNE